MSVRNATHEEYQTLKETADSPRWLIGKGRKEDAVNVLNRVRPEEDVQSGATRLEVEAINEFCQNQEKAPWIEMIVRTTPVTLLLCLE